jgi:hypothetical protein
MFLRLIEGTRTMQEFFSSQPVCKGHILTLCVVAGGNSCLTAQENSYQSAIKLTTIF